MSHRLTCDECGDFAVIANAPQAVIEAAMEAHSLAAHASVAVNRRVVRKVRSRRRNQSVLESELEVGFGPPPRRILIRSVHIAREVDEDTPD